MDKDLDKGFKEISEFKENYEKIKVNLFCCFILLKGIIV